MFLNARRHTCVRENYTNANTTIFNINLDDGTVTIKGGNSEFWTGTIVSDTQAIHLILYNNSDFIPYITTPLLFNVNYNNTSPVGYHIKVIPVGDALSNLTQTVTIKENTVSTNITHRSMGSFKEPYVLIRNIFTWIIP